MATTTRITTFASLVEGYQHTDPKLYQILQGFIQALGEVQAELDPVVKQITDTRNTIAAPSSAPTTIAYEILNRRILRIYWSGAVNAAVYEVRVGSNWLTATFITTTSQLEVRLDPILAGDYTYQVKARNGLGFYSDTTGTVVVHIDPVGPSTISAQVIDNNVLLRYSEPPATWIIDYYNIYRGEEKIGQIDGTFFVWLENIAGSYVYSVEAVDIAGNRGPRASVSASVNQPPDFELQDERSSLLSGVRVNAIPYGEPVVGWDYSDTLGWPTSEYVWVASNTGKLLVCIDPTETWQEHFIEGDS